MSGWDEGNVYYTDQGTAGERDDGEGITPGQARRKFADFFRNFRGDPTAEFPDGRLVRVGWHTRVRLVTCTTPAAIIRCVCLHPTREVCSLPHSRAASDSFRGRAGLAVINRRV